MRIGIVGCGQLARMLALAGWPLGLRFSFLGEGREDDAPVRGLGGVVHYQSGEAPGDIYRRLGEPDVITVEKEQVDTDLLRALGNYCPVYPDPDIVHICQHRGREKAYVAGQGVGTAPYACVEDRDQLRQVIDELGLPLIIKSHEQGYDGQNQWRLNRAADAAPFLDGLQPLPPAVVEQRISFQREVSILAVRDRSGDLRVYPAVENVHRDGILLTSLAPAPAVDAALQSQLDDIVTHLMSGWDYVGMLCIECFVTEDGVLVNELAPRVHNSGHWTQQGATTSQFENHLRAITGMGLGDVRCHTPTAMVNLLGVAAPAAVTGLPNAHVHLYNKTLKPRRKVGHVNLLNDGLTPLSEQMTAVLQTVYPE